MHRQVCLETHRGSILVGRFTIGPASGFQSGVLPSVFRCVLRVLTSFFLLRSIN